MSQQAQKEWDAWMASRSPRRVLLEELHERFHDLKRELWQMAPCPACRPDRRQNPMHPTLPIPLLLGQAVEGNEVVPCKECKGLGFLIDWENER